MVAAVSAADSFQSWPLIPDSALPSPRLQHFPFVGQRSSRHRDDFGAQRATLATSRRHARPDFNRRSNTAIVLTSIPLPGNRHDYLVTQRAAGVHRVSGHRHVILAAPGQRQGRSQDVLDVAHVLIIASAGAPKNLVSNHFRRCRRIPREEN